MKTKKVEISVFQIVIFIIVILTLTVVVNIVKENVSNKKGNNNKNIIKFGKFEETGSLDDPFKIETVEDLIELSNIVNSGNTCKDKVFKLMNDIDFNDEKSYKDANDKIDDINGDGKVDSLKDELNKLNGFESIGNRDNKYFEGTFDGDNKSIKNFNKEINDIKDKETLIGLFGRNKGNISRLKVSSNIKVSENIKSKKINLAILSAINEGKIEDCKVEGNIIVNSIDENSDIKIASISALNCGNIKDCVNSVNINSSYLTGGIVSLNYLEKNIENSGEITNCTNLGEIKQNRVSDKYIGGIVGENREGSIVSCNNNGNLEGKKVGGIVGRTTGNVSASKNMGNIINLKENSKNEESLGGIAAILETANIENSKNSGMISGTTNVGGITGENRGNIVNCTNEGKISKIDKIVCKTVNLGGISGININYAKISQSKNYGKVESSADDEVNIGGIVGKMYSDSAIEQSENNGGLMGVGKDIVPNEDLNDKCKSCTTNNGGNADIAEFGKLNIGIIYGIYQEV